ncbi:phage tail fiber protein [Pectobacterium parmentieri]|uniref:phage tail fiber protein n=1 Tax=Pectobacterium parmentieri TaxID=1905730 RepID=UPI0015FED985|nr:hypothetical protein [Pectobacterium parmentieri]
MSEITPNDLPPINELDEFTAKIPELQIDTDVLAGTGGPANFQAQALANRTKYLKRILDAVSLELTGINQAVAAAQQSADASMKKSANGADIADAAQFRNNAGLKNAATHDVQASATDRTAGCVLKMANNGEGPFGLGSRCTILNTTDVVVQLRSAVNGWYRCSANTVRAPSTGAWTFLVMKFDDNTRCVIAISAVTGQGVQFITIGASSDSGWTPLWGSNNLVKQTSQDDTTAGSVILNGGHGLGANARPRAAGSTGGAAGCNFFSYAANNADNPFGGTGASGIHVQEAANYGWDLLGRDGSGADFRIRQISAGTAGPWSALWTGINLPNPATLDTAQTISGNKTFTGINTDFTRVNIGLGGQTGYPQIRLTSTLVSAGSVGRMVRFEYEGAQYISLFRSDGTGSTTGQQILRIPIPSGSPPASALVAGINAVADSSGAWKTASPVINIYADGSFTTTDDADGVNVERLREGVYRITGCQGMHPDAAWNGIDGGVSNPKCRNDKALLWNNYEVHEDGSVTVYTFHRVHPDAMPFAQNRLTLDKQPFDAKKGHKLEDTWPDQTPIDVPRGLFIQVRVNMPERIELKPTVMHSNVYCNSVSPAK